MRNTFSVDFNQLRVCVNLVGDEAAHAKSSIFRCRCFCAVLLMKLYIACYCDQENTTKSLSFSTLVPLYALDL